MSVAVNLRIVDLRGRTFTSSVANELVPRASIDITKAVEQIIPLLEDVRESVRDVRQGGGLPYSALVVGET